MEAAILVFIVLFFAPLIMSIVALIKSHSLKGRLHRLENELKQVRRVSRPHSEEGTEVPNQYKAHAPESTDLADISFPPDPQSIVEMVQEVSSIEIPPEPPPEMPPVFIEPKAAPPGPTPPKPLQSESKETVEENKPEEMPEWQEFLHGLLFRGNPIAKIAIIILIFGVGFAIKLAALKGLFPLELRLILVALGGLVMTLVGIRIREKERTYAKILMGGGLTIVYLTFFGAGRFWELLPNSLSLSLMIGCMICATGLAYFIKSQSMAILSFSGGYIAPLLISTGSHDHVQLFTLYLLFNLAILFLSKKHNWRWLTVFGFFCTYVLGAVWGFSDYQHSDFASVEPFLIANWLIYLLAGHFLSLNRSKVIVSLILGPTLASFGLQSLMLKDYPLWMASACFIAALAHAAICFWLHRNQRLGLLKEFNGHIAAGLMTISIPLALSERWTSAAWSVEAVALVWIGLRTQRWILKASGIGLLIASGVSLGLDWPSEVVPQTTGSILIAFSSLCCARLLHKTKLLLHDALSWYSFLWASAWWWIGIIVLSAEIFIHEIEGWILLGCLSAFVAHAIGLKWKSWSFLSIWGFALLLFGILTFSATIKFVVLSPVIFIVTLTFWTLTRWRENEKRLHGFFNLLLIVFYGVMLSFWLDHFLPDSLAETDWIIWLYPAVFGFLFIPSLFSRSIPPWSAIRSHRVMVGILYLAPVGIWFFILSLINAGDFAPLPYVPILNPGELLLIGFTAIIWIWALRPKQNHEMLQVITTGSILLAFSFSLGLVSRFAHHYWSIPWSFDDMFQSSKWQALLAIEWTLFGIAGLISGSIRQSRSLWIAGAAVTGLVVLKLFLIDLSFSGTGPRVITFLAVGLLLLIVGYKAPFPTLPEEEAEEQK